MATATATFPEVVSPAPTTASALRKPRRTAKKAARTFMIIFHIEGDDYIVSPQPCVPAGCRAFRFRKVGGDKAVYELYVSREGCLCDCKGFLRHGHCKHTETCLAAAKVFGLEASSF